MKHYKNWNQFYQDTEIPRITPDITLDIFFAVFEKSPK